MGIYRGASGNLLYDMQLDMHKKYFPGWKAELTLYNAVMAKGFMAGGGKLAMDFAKWDPRQRRLMVDLTLQMRGGMTGYLGTATSKNLQTGGQDVQGKVVAYDFAGIAHSFIYDMVLEKLNTAAGDHESMLRDTLVQQMETMKNNANLILWAGKTAQVLSSCEFSAAAQTIIVPPGVSVQNLYVGMLLSDTTAVGSTISSGNPLVNYHGEISAIDEFEGGYKITYVHYDQSTATQFTSAATTAHLHGQYNVSPYGLLDFVTAGNTVGDLARTGRYNPIVKAAADVSNFSTDPAAGIVGQAARIRRNTSNAVRINMVLMSDLTAIWLQGKYASRLQVNQTGALRAANPEKKAFGFDPIFEISPSITAYICDTIPDGETILMDSNNIGFTPLPGEDAGPNYVDQLASDAKGAGIRIHGTLNKETALVWLYQLYARDLGGFGRIHTISLT